MSSNSILSTNLNILNKIASTISSFSTKYLTVQNPSGYGIFTFNGDIDLNTNFLSAGDVTLTTSSLISAFTLLSGKIKELSSTAQEISSNHYYVTQVEVDAAVSAAVAKIYRPTALSDLISAHTHSSDQIGYNMHTLTYTLTDIYSQLNCSNLSGNLSIMNNVLNQLNI